MSDHDPLCQFSHPIPEVSAWCSCPALRLARADERERLAGSLSLKALKNMIEREQGERIAQAIEAVDDERGWIGDWHMCGDDCAAVMKREAARIARNGGRDE